MSSAAGIKAGKAYVELSLREKIAAGLKAARQRLAAFGAGLTSIGTKALVVSGAVTGALAAIAKGFSDAGSEIFDLSQATGVSAEELSALNYAAGQSGAGVSDLAAGFRSLGKFSLNVSKGSKSAADALARMGISSEDFLAASPEQRLAMVADGLANIHDEGLKTAIAMQVLGKGGAALLPMLKGGSKGLNEMKNRAAELGAVMTAEDAAKADALGDAWGDLGNVMLGVRNQVGAALAEALTKVINLVVEGAQVVLEFVRNNQQLVMWIAIGAVALGAIGAALITFGVLASAAGMAIGGIMAAVTAAGAVLAAIPAVLAAIFSPIGLVIAAVVALGVALIAGAGYFLFFTQVGQAMVSIIVAAFGQLWAWTKKVFQGIWDALMSGNWQLAGQIAMAALNVAWQAGISALMQAWQTFNAWVVSSLAKMLDTVLLRIQAVVGIMQAVLQAQASRFGIKIGDTGLVGMIDQARAGLKSIAAASEGAANTGAAAALARLKEAQDELERLTKLASDERQQKADAAAITFEPGGEAGGPFTSPSLAGTTAGTFSGAIAGLLGRAGQTIEKQIAENTGKSAELLDEINGKFDGEGLEALE